MKHKIVHTADIQVQIREKNLRISYEKCLSSIVQKLIDTKADIYVIVGDLFEYDQSNDAEKSVLYEHLSTVLSLDSIKEVVIMCGNHDIEKERKRIDILEHENSINTFYNLIKALDRKYSSKLTYLKYSEPVQSIASDKIIWCPWSLEDNMSCRNKDVEILNDKIGISLFHDILKEYAEEVKLPLQKSRFESLVSVAEFKTKNILAGDIHVNWECTKNNKNFWYPGSPIQRNFGEGTYCKISDKYIVIEAEKKSVKQYSFDDETLEFTKLDDIILPDFVSYITFEVLPDATYEQIFNNIKEILLQKQVNYGLKQTFFKLKLSNLLTEHEMDLHKLITSIVTSQSESPLNIEISYNKFVQVNTQTNVDKILSSDNEENNLTEIKEENINVDNAQEVASSTNLSLNSSNLRKLFLYVLDQRMELLVKENPGQNEFIENVYKSIVDLFDSELSQSLGDTNKISINLESVECNAFQILGKNLINLDVPGIVRITGTNGIGKTTLFSMLRWVIRGQLYEGMPKNTIKKNTLLVFNNKQPNIDEIIVKFKFTINERVKVEVVRTAQRTWKAKTTDEQKKQLNWQDYISGVTMTVRLHTKSDKGERHVIGDQAQSYLDTWFAQTPETIMFLNHAKIASILNTAPKELNQTVLDFIGVDYLDILETRLESVKDSLVVTKPKRNRDVILEDIRSTTSEIDSNNNLIEKTQSEIEFVKQTLESQEQTINEISDVIESYGNIPEMISEKHSILKNVNYKIEIFEPKEFKSFVEKDFEMPKEPNVTELENKRDSISDKITSLSKDKDKVIETYTSLENEMLNIYNDKISNSQHYIEILDSNIISKSKEISVTENTINMLSSNVSNSICPTCHRPFEDDEQHSKQREEWKAEIEILKKKTENLKNELDTIIENKEKLKKVVTELNNRKMLCKNKDLELLQKIEKSQKLYNLIDKLNLSLNYIDKIEGQIHNLIQERNVIQIDITNIISSYGKEVAEYNNKCSNVDKINKEIQEYNNNVDKHNQSINEYKITKNQLEKDLQILEEKQPKYFEALNTRNEYRSMVQKSKSLFEEKSNTLKNAEYDVVNLQNKLENLKTESNEYTKYFVNNTIYKIYDRLIKQDFKSIVFEYYRNFLNNNLNNLLEEQNFKLFWNNNNELYMIDLRNGKCSYTPVQLTSGMEISFLGLSLIYTMSCLNIKNHISHIFLDEIGGSLNDGKNLNYEAKNYQELFVSILSKFKNITMFIIDHTIKNMYETVTLEVQPSDNGSVYVEI